MSALAVRVLSRAAIITGLAFACASPFFAAEPALALCKQGGPNCAPPWNKPPSFGQPGGQKIPDSGWVDPDCQYYGNCLSPNSARRTPRGR